MKLFLPKHFTIRLKQKKEYKSPFESINFQDLFELQPFKGSLGEVVHALDLAINLPNHKERNTILTLSPTRILRGILAYKENVNTEEVEDVYFQAVLVCLLIFDRKKEGMVLWNRLLNNKTFQKMYPTQIEQKIDIVGWEATKPFRSKSTADRLSLRLGGSNMLFIPFACGAIDAGIDVFHMYNQITRSKGSMFYPLKFSKYKAGNSQLQLSPNEKIMLIREANKHKRKVVLFDENILSGGTTKEAKEVLSSTIFLKKDIYIETNLNIKDEIYPSLPVNVMLQNLSHHELDQLALEYYNKLNHYF